jgi:DNA-binding SARP family transcriptional activator
MLKVRLLGRCALESEPDVTQDLKCRNSRHLLTYLVCHRNRNLTREAVIDALWSDMQEEQGKRTLRQALWHLQPMFGQFQIKGSRPFIEADGEWLRLNTDSGIWIDIVRFDELEKMTRIPKGGVIPDDHLQNLKEAVSIYRGHLLDDCLSDWCNDERRVLSKKYLRILTSLMLKQEENRDYEEALETAQRLLREEPASGNAHRVIMSFHYQEGDRTAALRQFEQYKQVMREELNAPPEKSMVDLYKRISDDCGSEDDNSKTDIPTRPLFEEQLITILGALQREIIQNRKEIRELKELIDRKKSSGDSKKRRLRDAERMPL